MSSTSSGLGLRFTRLIQLHPLKSFPSAFTAPEPNALASTENANSGPRCDRHRSRHSVQIVAPTVDALSRKVEKNVWNNICNFINPPLPSYFFFPNVNGDPISLPRSLTLRMRSIWPSNAGFGVAFMFS